MNCRFVYKLFGMFALLAAAAPPADAQCTFEWSALGAGSANGVGTSEGTSSAMATIGGALFVTGNFTTAGGLPNNGIARWDGTSWSSMGGGLTGGSPLAASIVEWNGDIYVGGRINNAGGSAANKLAKWNGSAWSILGAGITGNGDEVKALGVYNNALYVAGAFSEAGLVPGTGRLAKWDGTTWSPVGGGVTAGSIDGLTVHGGELYLQSVSSFTMAGTMPVTGGLAKWDGTNWSPVPTTGLEVPGTFLVFKLFSVNDTLYCSVRYTGPTRFRLAQWTGAAWSLLPGDFNSSIGSLAWFDDGSGAALHVGGFFNQVGTLAANHAAKWDGAAWSALGTGGPNAVSSLAVFNGGLYANAGFIAADPSYPRVYGVSRWGCNPTGACCLPSGSCEVRTAYTCTADSGTYLGNDVVCGGCMPAPTGACCTTTTCSIMWRSGPGGCLRQNGGVYQGDGTACSAPCPTRETEANDTKAAANAFSLVSGQQFAGISGAASTSSDFFKIQTAAAPLGIYEHRLVLTSTTPGHLVELMGSRQNNPSAGTWPCSLGSLNPGSSPDDTTLQIEWRDGDSRVNTWYGFGKQEQVYVRVRPSSDSSVTKDAYVATLQSTPITPTEVGPLADGVIALTTIDLNPSPDTSVWVFDQNLAPIPGYSCNGASATSGAGSVSDEAYLQRSFEPGTYYLAVSTGALQTSLGVPCDDSQPYFMSDFPNALIARAGFFNDRVFTDTYPVNVSCTITDSVSSFSAPGVVTQANQVVWFKLSVFPRRACCLPDGSCVLAVGADECASAYSGTFKSDSYTCEPPVLAFSVPSASIISDNSGNGNHNGFADPGETSIGLLVPLLNSRRGWGGCDRIVGSPTVTGITATLSSLTPTATVISATAAYPDMTYLATASNTTPFVIALESSHQCGAPINLRLSLSAAGGFSAEVNFAVPGGAPPVVTTATWTNTANPAAGVPVPDGPNGVVTVTLNVAGLANPIADLDLRFDNADPANPCSSVTAGMTHDNPRHLIITLTSPQGTPVIVSNLAGGSSDDYCGTVFDDEASATIPDVPLHSGRFLPSGTGVGMLSTFDGQNANGNWTLRVEDTNSSGNAGVLRKWSLVFTDPPICTPPSASNQSCCRGTTCNAVPAGSCIGTVAGSNSIVLASCGSGNSFASCCYADYNHDGLQSIDDLFLYFNAYFTTNPMADFGGTGTSQPTIDDLFLYINAYFSTCN